jgi:hypothetical protein
VTAADHRDDYPSLPKLPRPGGGQLSQADEYLRRVIAAEPVKLPKLPSEPAARRRAIQQWGW